MICFAMTFASSPLARAQQTDGPLPAPTANRPPAASQQPPAPAPANQSPPAAAPAQAAGTPSSTGQKIVLPAGTKIPLVLHNGISTRSAKAGDGVYFETLFPVMQNGKVVIPAGSYVSGEITESARPGRVKGRGEIGIRLNTLILPNTYVVDLNAQPSSAATGGGETVDPEGHVKGDSDKASDAGVLLGTTGVGAGIGSIGGAKGAGIGAGIGLVAGLATVLLTRGPDVELPRGSTLEAQLNRALSLDADKVNFTSLGQASALAGPPNREPVRSKIPF
jgi:hypothetical protein